MALATKFAAVLMGCSLVCAVSAASAQESREPGTLARAPPGSVRLFVSGSMSAPVAAIRDTLERATGRKVVLEVSESRNLLREMEAGQPFEATLMTAAVMDDLVAKGLVVPGSTQPIGMVRVGVAVRGDAPKLEVRQTCKQPPANGIEQEHRPDDGEDETHIGNLRPSLELSAQ